MAALRVACTVRRTSSIAASRLPITLVHCRNINQLMSLELPVGPLMYLLLSVVAALSPVARAGAAAATAVKVTGLPDLNIAVYSDLMLAFEARYHALN